MTEIDDQSAEHICTLCLIILIKRCISLRVASRFSATSFHSVTSSKPTTSPVSSCLHILSTFLVVTSSPLFLSSSHCPSSCPRPRSVSLSTPSCCRKSCHTNISPAEPHKNATDRYQEHSQERSQEDPHSLGIILTSLL